MILEAPNRLESYSNIGLTFFLAGSIDNGEAYDWQREICDYSKEIKVNVFNPRRSEWDKNIYDKEIERQIDWELEHMEKADYIIMNILADSKSPISLLELGLHAKSGKLIVFCPKKFYRYNNVRVTCETYGVKLCSIDRYKDNMDEIKLLMLEKKKMFENDNRRKN